MHLTGSLIVCLREYLMLLFYVKKGEIEKRGDRDSIGSSGIYPVRTCNALWFLLIHLLLKITAFLYPRCRLLQLDTQALESRKLQIVLNSLRYQDAHMVHIHPYSF